MKTTPGHIRISDAMWERLHPATTLVEKLAALRGPEPTCKSCDDTGYYFDNNGHGQFTWKRRCPCREGR